MPIRLLDAELRAYRPGDSDAFVTVGRDNLGETTIDETAQEAMDTGTILVENSDGVADGVTRITSGDRLELYVQLEGESSLEHYWTAMARDLTDTVEPGPGITRTEIEATDFVFSTLSFRAGDGSFEGVDAGDVADTLVASAAPEVGRSQIETVGEEVDISVSGRFIADVIEQDLAPQGDAIIAADGTDLVFRSLGSVEVKHSLRLSDVLAPIEVERVDDDLINRVRIDGGDDHAVDDEQLTQSDTQRVTDSNRLTTKVQTRKSEVARVQLHTEPDADSDDDLVVRLQADRGGSPVDIDDRSSDLARRSLSSEFLADGDFTEFQLPAHTLSPEDEPFIIVEASDSDGHDVGTDGSGTPTYQAEFPFPLLARAESSDSQQRHRRRDLRRRDDALQTEQAVQDAATAALRHRTEPARRVTVSADSRRAHRLQPAEVVRLEGIPVSDVSGRYAVVERETVLAETLLRTELTLQETSTI